MKLLNDVLDDLIARAKNTRSVEDIEELERRNYNEVDDPSMLRFLVDMRGADIDNKQLRDDLMTMLIAGHETTAAVLTWALFELSKNDDIMTKLREEIDDVVGDRQPTYEDIEKMKYLRLVIAETLRLYPEPPLLIRRCRTEDHLPKGKYHASIFNDFHTQKKDSILVPTGLLTVFKTSNVIAKVGEERPQSFEVSTTSLCTLYCTVKPTKINQPEEGLLLTIQIQLRVKAF